MSQKRYIEIDSTTHRYEGHFESEELTSPNEDGSMDYLALPGRYILIQDIEDTPPVAGSTWDGNNFIPPPESSVVTMLSRGEFIDRIPMPTQMALETIGEQQDDAGRLVRIFTRRLEAETMVSTSSPVILAGFNQLKPILIAAGVSGWEDEAAANATIEAILS